MFFDCSRYLLRATVRNFSIPGLFNSKTVPVVKIDPKTVRPKAAAVDDAIRREVEAVDAASSGGLASSVLGGDDPLDSIEVLTYFELSSERKRVLRAYVEKRKEESREFLEKRPASGEAVTGSLEEKDEQWTIGFHRARIEKAEAILANLDHPPTRTADQLAAPEVFEGTEVGDQNLIYDRIEKWVGWLFRKESRPAKLLRDVRRIVLEKETDISGTNTQIREFWAKELFGDPVLYADTVDFYSRLRRIEASGLVSAADRKEATLFDPPSALNVWGLALDGTGGDVSRAMRVLSVFGHDDQAQRLAQFNLELQFVDVFAPEQPSFLYRNGAVDGLRISERLRDRFVELKREADALAALYPKSKETIFPGTFRAGNYHFIGGAMMVNELLRLGNDHFLGVNLPVLAAEAAGKAYKRITMERSYMSEGERYLFGQGYPAIPVAKPRGWSDEEFAFRKLKVRLQLAHLDLTHEQHLRGAQWAYGLLKKNGVTRYAPAVQSTMR